MIGIGIPISHRRMPRMSSPLFLTFPKRHSVDEVPFGSSAFHYLGLRSHRRRSTRLRPPRPGLIPPVSGASPFLTHIA